MLSVRLTTPCRQWPYGNLLSITGKRNQMKLRPVYFETPGEDTASLTWRNRADQIRVRQSCQPHKEVHLVTGLVYPQ